MAEIEVKVIAKHVKNFCLAAKKIFSELAMGRCQDIPVSGNLILIPVRAKAVSQWTGPRQVGPRPLAGCQIFQ